MKKQTKRLRLSTETLRTLQTAELKNVDGGLMRLRTITCDLEECDSYACLTAVGCA